MSTKVEISLLLVSAAAFCCCLVMTAESAVTEHLVGGKELGWSIPPNGTYYQDWAKQREFHVHDKLLFNFGPMHSLFEVGSKEDFEKCTVDKLIKQYRSVWGPVVVDLTQPGDRYFQGAKCDFGQKLHITVDDPRVVFKPIIYRTHRVVRIKTIGNFRKP